MDVWALGVMLYEHLAGATPFEDATTLQALIGRIGRADIPPLTDVNPEVPAALEAVCLTALRRKPANRYPDAAAFAEALQAADGEAASPRMGSRSLKIAGAAAGAIALALVGACAAWSRPPPNESPPTVPDSTPAAPSSTSIPETKRPRWSHHLRSKAFSVAVGDRAPTQAFLLGPGRVAIVIPRLRTVRTYDVSQRPPALLTEAKIPGLCRGAAVAGGIVYVVLQGGAAHALRGETWIPLALRKSTAARRRLHAWTTEQGSLLLDATKKLLRLYLARDGTTFVEQDRLESETDDVQAAAYHPALRQLAVASWTEPGSSTVELYPLSGGPALISQELDGLDRVNSIAPHEGGFVAGTRIGRLLLLDANLELTGQLLKPAATTVPIRAHNGAIDLTLANRWLYTVGGRKGGGRVIKVWDLQERVLLQSVEVRWGRVIIHDPYSGAVAVGGDGGYEILFRREESE
jgi:hypothetical protein